MNKIQTEINSQNQTYDTCFQASVFLQFLALGFVIYSQFVENENVGAIFIVLCILAIVASLWLARLLSQTRNKIENLERELFDAQRKLKEDAAD